MAAKTQRPYVRSPGPEGFEYWKKNPIPTGIGWEAHNYASPLALEIWYYLRALGRAKHPPGWMHKHRRRDGFLLHIVQRGQLWHEVKGQRHLARRGEAALLDLSADLTHGVGGTRPAEFYWVLFNGRDVPRMFLELGADQNPVFLLRDMPRLLALVRRLESITIRESRAYEAEASGLLMLVLAQLFASRSDRVPAFLPSQSGRPLSESVRKVIDYITRQYDESLTSKHLAWIARQSLTYFSRRFHQEVGLTPIAYLNRYRVEQAKKFLTDSNQSIDQIARSVGFRDRHYFTRMFVRIVGVTPLAYRKKPEKFHARRGSGD